MKFDSELDQYILESILDLSLILGIVHTSIDYTFIIYIELFKR